MKRFICFVLSTALVLGLTAGNVMAETSAKVSSDAIANAKKEAKSGLSKVVQEAVDALVLTHKVLDKLGKKDTAAALKDLEKAIGKLEVVLANQKAPALLPIDSSIVAVEYAGDLDSIHDNMKEVKKLIKEGHIQEARRLLDTIQSEIDIITVNLPLVSYPQALKLAAKYLHENKTDEAKDVLEMALNTLVRTEIIIPIPLLKAEALIDEAKKSAKKDKEQALKHLDAARTQLKLAEALGYTSSSDTSYKNLDDAISSIEKEIKGKNKAEKLFDELKAKLYEFKERAVKSFSSQTGEQGE